MLTVKSREILRPLPPVFPVLQQQVCLTSHFNCTSTVIIFQFHPQFLIQRLVSGSGHQGGLMQLNAVLLWHFYWLHLGGIKIAIPPSVGHQSTGEWVIPLPIDQIPAIPSSGGICRRMWSIWRALTPGAEGRVRTTLSSVIGRPLCRFTVAIRTSI